MAVIVFVEFVVVRCEFVFSLQDLRLSFGVRKLACALRARWNISIRTKAAASCRTPKSPVAVISLLVAAGLLRGIRGQNK